MSREATSRLGYSQSELALQSTSTLPTSSKMEADESKSLSVSASTGRVPSRIEGFSERAGTSHGRKGLSEESNRKTHTHKSREGSRGSSRGGDGFVANRGSMEAGNVLDDSEVAPSLCSESVYWDKLVAPCVLGEPWFVEESGSSLGSSIRAVDSVTSPVWVVAAQDAELVLIDKRSLAPLLHPANVRHWAALRAVKIAFLMRADLRSVSQLWALQNRFADLLTHVENFADPKVKLDPSPNGPAGIAGHVCRHLMFASFVKEEPIYSFNDSTAKARVYMVVSGMLYMYLHAADGTRTRVSTVRAGELAGHLDLLRASKRRKYSLVSGAASTCLSLSREQYLFLFSQLHSFLLRQKFTFLRSVPLFAHFFHPTLKPPPDETPFASAALSSPPTLQSAAPLPADGPSPPNRGDPAASGTSGAGRDGSEPTGEPNIPATAATAPRVLVPEQPNGPPPCPPPAKGGPRGAFPDPFDPSLARARLKAGDISLPAAPRPVPEAEAAEALLSKLPSGSVLRRRLPRSLLSHGPHKPTRDSTPSRAAAKAVPETDGHGSAELSAATPSRLAGTRLDAPDRAFRPTNPTAGGLEKETEKETEKPIEMASLSEKEKAAAIVRALVSDPLQGFYLAWREKVFKSAGSVILRQGEVSTFFYIIFAGQVTVEQRVAVDVTTPATRAAFRKPLQPLRVALLTPGSVFGFEAVTGSDANANGPGKASEVRRSPVSYISGPGSTFLYQVCKEDVTEHFPPVIAERLGQHGQRWESWIRERMATLLAHFDLTLPGRVGATRVSAPTDSGGGPLREFGLGDASRTPQGRLIGQEKELGNASLQQAGGGGGGGGGDTQLGSAEGIAQARLRLDTQLRQLLNRGTVLPVSLVARLQEHLRHTPGDVEQLSVGLRQLLQAQTQLRLQRLSAEGRAEAAFVKATDKHAHAAKQHEAETPGPHGLDWFGQGRLNSQNALASTTRAPALRKPVFKTMRRKPLEAGGGMASLEEVAISTQGTVHRYAHRGPLAGRGAGGNRAGAGRQRRGDLFPYPPSVDLKLFVV